MQRIAFYSLKSKLGTVYIAGGAGGVRMVQIGGTAAAFRNQYRRKYCAEPVSDPAMIKKASIHIDEYLRGKRKTFPLPVDWSKMSDFQRRVLRAALAIPYGETRTYGEIARRIGRPRAARAVGQALGANPVPIVIPCHRVLAGGGGLGGYSAAGGVRVKRKLLDLEKSIG